MVSSESAESPHVSAVICTRNRPDKIATAVTSVLGNSYPTFDLTVIDQSTTDATEMALQALTRDDARLRYVHVEEAGLSRAYNTGIAQTTGQIIAFTDDDCIVPQQWLRTIVDAFESDREGDLLYGRVSPASGAGDDADLTPLVEIERPERLSRRDGFRVFGMGANFAARRRLFSAIGGFDEMLGGGGPLRSSQDFDLAYRAFRAGSVILLRPEVSLLHDGHRDRADWPALLRNYGIGDGAFYAKHVRCGDWYALLLLMRRLGRTGARVAVKSLLRRDPQERFYLRGMFVGIWDGSKFKVDRSARSYVSR